MLKTSLAILLATAIAIGGGGWSLLRALEDENGTGALRTGAWSAFPEIGSPNADPYSKARAAREGILALGSAEGVAFSASTDSEGKPLRAQCSYRVEGNAPSSRFWTLFAAGLEAKAATEDGMVRLPALNSRTVVRRPDNSFSVIVAPRPAPGNWIEVSGAGPMSLVLTVYDTNIATGTELSDASMPQIVSLGCDA